MAFSTKLFVSRAEEQQDLDIKGNRGVNTEKRTGGFERFNGWL